MNRLQKKCVIGTVGIHLLLLLILIVGPAFYNQEPKNDDTQVLDVIPSNLIDANANSGVQGAQPPPTPKPITPQPLFAPPKIVQPPAPAPTPTPAPAPTLTPTPSLLEKFEKMFAPKPDTSVKPDLTPTEKQTTAQPHKDDIKIDLHKVNRTQVKNTSRPDNTQNRQAINNALQSLKSSLASATKIDVPGTSSAAYANYASVVKSVYERTLLTMLPDEIAQNNENTKVSVTIANDGTVVSSEIVSPSGDPTWDAVVQRTLDQVTFIAPFPDGATEKERHYTINFNPQVERALQ
jgi:TonB family protein